jgi:hypothetical protein
MMAAVFVCSVIDGSIANLFRCEQRPLLDAMDDILTAER